MKKYIRLMRMHHYIKNFLICAPIFFSGRILEPVLWGKVLWAFLAFGMLSSLVYIVNDIRDVENDRKHPTKCKRPIASGEISVKGAVFFAGILVFLIFVCCILGQFGVRTIGTMAVYLLLNLLYSFGLKNYPVVDIAILASGFVLRLLLGSVVTGILISDWLYLTVTMAAFYFALGKRRNERIKYGESDTRKVLKAYSKSFLNSMMYMCLALTIVFYSLWTVDSEHEVGNFSLIWTVPIVLLICMKYCMVIESDSDGDPVEVLIHDKTLLMLCCIWAVIIVAAIYVF